MSVPSCIETALKVLTTEAIIADRDVAFAASSLRRDVATDAIDVDMAALMELAALKTYWAREDSTIAARELSEYVEPNVLEYCCWRERLRDWYSDNEDDAKATRVW